MKAKKSQIHHEFNRAINRSEAYTYVYALTRPNYYYKYISTYVYVSMYVYANSPNRNLITKPKERKKQKKQNRNLMITTNSSTNDVNLMEVA